METTFPTGVLDLEKRDDVAIVWLDDGDRSVNAISREVIDEFDAVLDAIEQDEDVRAVIFISRKPNSFIVGADIDELKDLSTPQGVEALSRLAHRMVVRMQGLRKPTVAAMHGAVMGGGLEMALSCTYRVATDHDATRFGLPEVKLGLLPGGGGTQFLPRLLGLQQALPIMLTGKNVYPGKARRIGLVDALTHRDGLLQAALAAARKLAQGELEPRNVKKPLQQRLLEGNALGRQIIYKKARQQVMRQTRGNYPAPLRILDCVRTGMEDGLISGLDLEARAFGELAVTPEARELLFLYAAQQRAEKNPYDEDEELQRVAVLGAGLMGAGIAQVSASGQLDVLLKDQDLALAAKGKQAIWQNMNKKVSKGALSAFERDVLIGRVRPAATYEDFGEVDLVIEAVPENLEIKHQVLEDVETATPDDCIFASNTSSIPITQIAEASKRPKNILGMHYFSPVPQIPLLEIIKTEKTSTKALARAFTAGRKQGKTIITVNDGPGFYTTRILAIYMNEALELLDEGAEIQQVDRAMKDFGFPMGPYELFDLVGINVAAKITDVLGEFFSDHRGLASNTSAAALVENEFTGQKSGGFYHYGEGTAGKREKRDANTDVYRLFGGSDRRMLDKQTIQHRLALIMVNEAVHCLADGILERPEDGDVGAVFGLGFPPFRGGPFRYVDSETAPAIVARLEHLRAEQGERFAPAELLNDQVQHETRFYPEDEK